VWAAEVQLIFWEQAASQAAGLAIAAANMLMMTLTFGLALRYGTGGYTRRDGVVLAVSASGLLAWRLTHRPVLALVLVLAVDCLASSLTLVKAYRDPASETLSSYLLAALAGLLSLAAVGFHELNGFANALYIMLLNGTVACTIMLGQRKLNTEPKGESHAANTKSHYV
jgi:hypothetical protein